MVDDVLNQVIKLLEIKKGDTARLQHIKETIENKKTLYNSDKKYLEKLSSKYLVEDTKQKEDISIDYPKKSKNICHMCDKKVSIISGFTCSYCGVLVCDNHRIPENHDCYNIHNVNKIQIIKNKYNSRKSNFEYTNDNQIYTKNKHKPIKAVFIFLIIFGIGTGLVYFNNTIDLTTESYIELDLYKQRKALETLNELTTDEGTGNITTIKEIVKSNQNEEIENNSKIMINNNQVQITDNNIQNNKVLIVYVEDIPNYSHESVTIKTVQNAIDDWSKLNPNLEFQLVTEKHNSNVEIKWTAKINYPQDISGITNSEFMVYDDGSIASENHEIVIDLVNLDCNGSKIFWSKESITDTIKHEIGHVLGLDHSSDVNHLMYDPDDGINNMPTLGHVIPSITDNYYIGQKEMVKQADILEIKYKNTLAEYGWSVNDWESGKKSTTNELFYNKVNSIIDEMNPIIDNLNCFSVTTNKQESNAINLEEKSDITVVPFSVNP